MLHIVWEFVVRPDRAKDFERHYSPSGTWASLFRKGSGYQRTDLLRDAADPNRYLTVDVWDDRASYERFKSDFAAEYAVIDKQCEELASEERFIGIFQDAP